VQVSSVRVNGSGTIYAMKIAATTAEKDLRYAASNRVRLASEIQVMLHLGPHPGILKIKGVSLVPGTQFVHGVLLEQHNLGSLADWLKTHAEEMEAQDRPTIEPRIAWTITRQVRCPPTGTLLKSSAPELFTQR
jgi:hypothetical protein